jgi:RHS repeat-associated protein
MIWRVILFLLLGASLAWADLPRHFSVASVASCKNYTGLLNYWDHPLDVCAYISDSWGLRTNITRQLGLSTNIVITSFDGIGQLMAWSGREASGTLRPNEQLGYAFDAAGNLQYRTNGAMIQTFTVNTLNQISNVTRTGTFTVTGATPAPAASVTVNGAVAQTNGDFTFARTNNTLANGNNTFTIIAQNALGVKATNSLTVNLPTPVNFQYDANGNLTNDGTRWFFYDGENQLTNVTVAGQYQVIYLYDGLSLRRIRRASAWQSGAWVQTNEVRYIYDGNNVIQERDASNNVLVTYTRALDLSASLQGAGGIGGLLARTDANGTTYYHSDGNGNITALMDGNQNIVARYEYDAFGRLVGMWGTNAAANVYRFSSKEYDSVTGLYYFGRRYYDPVLQRWLNQDPISELGGVNLYQFVGNNPVNNVDPYGLDPWYYWLNPLSYIPAYARHAGQAMLDAAAKARGHIDYETEMEGLNEGRHHDDTYDFQKSQMNAIGMIQEDAKEGAEDYLTVVTSMTPTAAGAKCVAAVVRTEARNLAEQIALKEAEAGAGNRIMEGLIKDPQFPENIWAKMQHVHGDTTIHYWQNLQTGERIGFKFKD